MLKTIVNSPVRSGNQTIKDGNLVIGTVGNGIDFSVNAHASGMTKEVLDWYEEGDWTPTDASGAGLTLTVSYAKYTRIGRQVSYVASITYPSTANATPARIGGFPFAAANAIFGNVNYTTVALATMSYFSGNTTELFLLRPGDNATNAQMSGAALVFSGTYFV